ncbi:MAG TPA: extracellular solute-binding protein [Candidatus Limnocylindria bacterium]|jgi:putative spermidine/putrescine transport system substrate-binding protein|nr:extracellular solute-binding protein [Candidatus Limnocylindria bacterium]
MRLLRIPVMLTVFGLLAAACSGGAPSGALTELPDAEGALNLVIWAGYAEDGTNDPNYDWVNPFVEETGCEVNTTDMTDSANGVELLQSGQYDGGSFSGDATLRLIAGEDVAPINTELIPYYADVFEGLKGQPHNTVDGVPYGTPHGRGANLLLYNTDTFTEAPTSWDPIWDADSPAAGSVSVYNSAIFIADAALRLKTTNDNEFGIDDPYQLTEEQFNAAVELLTEQHAIVGEYWNYATDQITSFGAGDMLAGTSWQYQANNLPDAPVGIVKPAEGTTGWSDTWMIASEAEHPGCMYRWMDWMLSPEANAQATVWFGEAPVTQAACDRAEELSPNHCEDYHATDEAYFEDVAFWSTPREDCNDEDDATTCKTIEDWIQAWTEITGS